MPATEKQGRGEPCDGEHPDVFRHEESCVFETGVFGHVAGDNFRFTFGHIEWSAIRFHKTGYKKQNERSCTPRREDKPAWHEAKCVSSLRNNNPVGYKRADDHHHREHGNYERQFVADHLRDSAHSPEHREFVIASPSGHEDRKLRCRSNRKEKQDAAIDRKRRHVPAIRNHPKGKNRRSSNENWSQEVHKLVRARRHDVFLYQHFDAVCHWLQKPERPNAIGAIAILYPAENLPFQYRHQREQRQKYSEQRENINETRRDLG